MLEEQEQQIGEVRVPAMLERQERLLGLGPRAVAAAAMARAVAVQAVWEEAMAARRALRSHQAWV